MFENNRHILSKADFALQQLVDQGGLLLPNQAKQFMRLSTLESTLLKETTYRPMSREKEQIDQIRFGQRVLRPAKELTPLAVEDRAVPDLSQVELSAKELIAEIDLSDRVLEENIEGKNLRNTLMQLLAPAVGRDLEEVVISGDVLSADPFLAQFDGIIAQSKSNIVDAGGAGLSDDLFSDMMQAMPKPFRKNKRELSFYTGSDAELNFRRKRADRLTAVGDKFLESDATVVAAGNVVKGVPLFPEDLGGTETTPGNQTVVILTHPKNVVVGVRRKIRLEWDRDIRRRSLFVVATLMADVKYAVEEAVVKAVNVSVSG